MTESQEKELFAMFRKQHEQAIAGDYVFMPTITPLHFGHILDRIEALEQDAENYAFLKVAMRDGGSRWYVHEASDDDVDAQITADRIAQQDKGKETV